MSVFAVVTLTAKPGQRDALLASGSKAFRLTRDNPDCLALQIVADTENDNVLILLEQWTTVAAHEQHVQKLVADGHLDAMAPLFARDIDTIHYQSM